MRSGASTTAVHRFPPPFKLAERGRPEVAVLWKNLIGAMRLSSFPVIALIMPIALVAGKATGITGNRYIRYPKGTPLANLHVTLLDKLGVRIEKFGDATGTLGKLSDQVLSNI